MRTLALFLALFAFGCDDDSAPPARDMAMMSTVDMACDSSCGCPGDPALNDTGVGKYCVTQDDCARPAGAGAEWRATLCSFVGDPSTNSHFCTFICEPSVMPSMCGSGATCVCNGIGCACAPAMCAPKGDGGA